MPSLSLKCTTDLTEPSLSLKCTTDLTDKEVREKYEALLSLYGLGDKAGLLAALNTLGDWKFDYTRKLFNISSRVIDVSSVLGDCVKTLTDTKALNSKNLTQVIRTIEKTIIPLQPIISSLLMKAARNLAPLNCMYNLHKRNEIKRKNDFMDNYPRKKICQLKEELPKKMLDAFLKDSSDGELSSLRTKKTLARVAKNKKMLPMSLKSVSSSIPERVLVPPTPKDGQTYSPAEFMDIIRRYEKNRKGQRKELMRNIIANGTLIPIKSIRTLYRLIDRVENQAKPAPLFWKKVGRQQIMSNEDLVECVKEFRKGTGKTIDVEEMKTIIQGHLRDKAERKGLVYSEKEIDITTAKNYLVILASQDQMHLTNTTAPKTNARYTAENSLRSALTLLYVVATTHFIVLETEDHDIRNIMKDMSPNDRELYDLVSDAYGNRPIFPLHPHLMFSSDDKTQYTFKGLAKTKQSEWVLASEESIRSRGMHAVYRNDNSNTMNGL